MSPNIAVLTFPGNNCEQETLRELKNSGFRGEIFLWNQNPSDLESFDGVVIPGGFSFEDRGRSGVIASNEPVIATLKEMGARGTPILGICNGAQILVESGMILEDTAKKPAISLSRNERKNNKGEVLGTGFYQSWRNLKPINKKTPFSHFSHTVNLPIAHGEGRFVIPEEIQEELKEKNCIVFEYVNDKGEADSHYPCNPNGSFENAAALCNPAGNIVAMMPHPERTQAGQAIFDSFFQYFSGEWVLSKQDDISFTFASREVQKNEEADIDFFVTLKITDKTEKSFETLLRKQYENPEISVHRGNKWSVTFFEELSLEEKKQRAAEMIESHELLNVNKEAVAIRIEGEMYGFVKGKGLKKSNDYTPTLETFEVREKQDFMGEYKKTHFSHLFPRYTIKNISHGIVWTVEGLDQFDCINSSLFASFVGEEIFDVLH